MSLKDDSRRMYKRLNKAYNSVLPKGEISISISLHSYEGKLIGEFLIDWEIVTEGELPVARFKAFEDSWKFLPYFNDLFEKMVAVGGKEMQEDEFSILLDGLGFEDATVYMETIKGLGKWEN